MRDFMSKGAVEELDQCIDDLKVIRERMLGRKYKDACNVAIKFLAAWRGVISPALDKGVEDEAESASTGLPEEVAPDSEE